MRFVFSALLLATVMVVPANGQEKPPLKVAMIIPIEPWDRKAGLEAWRKWMEDNYRVEITWIEPKTPLPTKDTPEADRKAYYATPPEIPDLHKAQNADVVFTALTHVFLNDKQSEELLKLLTTKPVVGGRRSHHGIYFKLPKGSEFAKLKNPGGFSGGYGDLIFGGGFAGHHGGIQQIKEGQAADRLKAFKTDPERVTAAHRLAFGRNPTEAEQKLAADFLAIPADSGDKLTRLEQYAQAILASNEFTYVD